MQSRKKLSRQLCDYYHQDVDFRSAWLQNKIQDTKQVLSTASESVAEKVLNMADIPGIDFSFNTPTNLGPSEGEDEESSEDEGEESYYETEELNDTSEDEDEGEESYYETEYFPPVVEDVREKSMDEPQLEARSKRADEEQLQILRTIMPDDARNFGDEKYVTELDRLFADMKTGQGLAQNLRQFKVDANKLFNNLQQRKPNTKARTWATVLGPTVQGMAPPAHDTHRDQWLTWKPVNISYRTDPKYNMSEYTPSEEDNIRKLFKQSTLMFLYFPVSNKCQVQFETPIHFDAADPRKYIKLTRREFETFEDRLRPNTKCSVDKVAFPVYLTAQDNDISYKARMKALSASAPALDVADSEEEQRKLQKMQEIATTKDAYNLKQTIVLNIKPSIPKCIWQLMYHNMGVYELKSITDRDQFGSAYKHGCQTASNVPKWTSTHTIQALYFETNSRTSFLIEGCSTDKDSARKTFERVGSAVKSVFSTTAIQDLKAVNISDVCQREHALSEAVNDEFRQLCETKRVEEARSLLERDIRDAPNVNGLLGMYKKSVAQKKATMFMAFGMSGTGKTTVLNNLKTSIEQDQNRLWCEVGIYGKLNVFTQIVETQVVYSIDSMSDSHDWMKTHFGKDIQPQAMDKNTLYMEKAWIKSTLNNPDSSRYARFSVYKRGADDPPMITLDSAGSEQHNDLAKQILWHPNFENPKNNSHWKWQVKLDSANLPINFTKIGSMSIETSVVDFRTALYSKSTLWNLVEQKSYTDHESLDRRRTQYQEIVYFNDAQEHMINTMKFNYFNLDECNMGDVLLQLRAKIITASNPANSPFSMAGLQECGVSMSTHKKAVLLTHQGKEFFIQLESATSDSKGIPYKRFTAINETMNNDKELGASFNEKYGFSNYIFDKYKSFDFVCDMMEEACFINGFIGEMANILFARQKRDDRRLNTSFPFHQASNIVLTEGDSKKIKIKEWDTFWKYKLEPKFGICYYAAFDDTLDTVIENIYETNTRSNTDSARLDNHTLVQKTSTDRTVNQSWFRIRTLFDTFENSTHESHQNMTIIPFLIVPNYPFNAEALFKEGMATADEEQAIVSEQEEVKRLLDNTRMINFIVFGVTDSRT